MRRLLGWLRRLGLAALALAVVALAAALIAAHTGWGREQLRREIEEQLRDAFPGGARVAALDGSVLGTLTLHGVEIDGRDHRPLVTAGTVRAAIALWPVASGTARVDRVAAADVRVYVRDLPPGPAAAPARRAAPSPWHVELPELAIHRARVEIERGGIALGELEATGALTAAAGRIEIDGAVRGTWSRAGGPTVPLAVRGTLVLDGKVRASAAHVALDGAAIDAEGLVIDAEHPSGKLTLAAPKAAITRLIPELGGTVPGDVTASIELADGPATWAFVDAAAGDARLWAALRGDPARRTAYGLVSAFAIDLERVTRGRLGGRGNVLAALAAGPDDVRGAVIAFGDVRAPSLPVRRAGVAIFGSLDDARALVLAGGDDGLELSGAARAHRHAGAIILDDARAVATSRAAVLPIAKADAAAGQAPSTRCRRITGALALSARAAGTLAPRPDLVVTGLAEGTRVEVEPTPGDVCDGGMASVTALAEQAGAKPPELRGAARVSIGALRSHFVLGVAPGEGGPGAGLDVAVAGDAAATAVTVDDLALASAGGSFALGVLPELRLDRAHVTGAGLRRAGRPLGDARVDIARRGATFGVAATAHPAGGGLTITTAASVARTRAGYVATLGASSVVLPGGAVWAGRGGSVTIAAPTDPARAAIELGGLSLHHGDAAVALSGRYAVPTGNLAAHARADRVDASAIDPHARGVGRATLDLARRGGQWQADGSIAASGLAAAPGAAPVDVAAHLGLVRGRATIDAHATGPALGGIDLALDVAAPRDPLDLGAWRRIDRDAIHRAAITARQVALSGLAALVGPGLRDPGGPSGLSGLSGLSGTIDGTVDLAPAVLRGGFTVRGVELPLGTIEGDVALAPHDGDLDAHAAARLVGIASADLTARFGVPQHPLDPETWQRRGRDLVREARGKLGDVAFDPALLARLGLASRLADHGVAAVYRGHASAQLTLGAAAGDAQLAVDLTGVSGGALAAPVSPHLALTAGPSGSHVRAELSGGGSRGDLDLGVLEGDVPMTVDRWLDEPAAVLNAPITARWTLPAAPLVPVLALLGRSDLAAGTLEGAATIRGTVRTPIIPSARLVARDVRFTPRLGGRAPPAIRELEARASWGGASGTVEITGREVTGGELHAVVNGRPDALAAATGTARLVRLDLAPFAALLPGALSSAAGIVDGDLALHPAGQVTGTLRVAGGALPLAPAIGTVRDATVNLSSDGETITARLEGKLGRGTIALDARAPAGDPTTVTAELSLDKVSPIAALRPVISAHASGQLRREADQLRGNVTIERGSIALPERAGTPLLDAKVPSDLVLAGAPAAPRGRRAPAHPWLVLDVKANALPLEARDLGEGVGFRGTLRSDRLEVSIGDTVGVRGKVDIARADVEFFGRSYQVGSSKVEFDGTTDPLLEIEMSHQFPELTLNVALRGRPGNWEKLHFSSDPGGYTEDQLFGFFLGGDPTGDPGSQTRDAVAGAGARLISSKLGRQINKVLPVKVDALSCEPAPSATTATSGSCTVGKWLSQRLFIAYRQHLQPRSDENTGDVQLQLRMGDKLLLEGTGGDRGYYGADLLWRHRW